MSSAAHTSAVPSSHPAQGVALRIIHTCVLLAFAAFIVALAFHFVRAAGTSVTTLPQECSAPAVEGESVRILLTLRDGQISVRCARLIPGPWRMVP